MINFDFENEKFEEPPLIRHLTNKELENFRTHPLIPSHPCHNQAVEWLVKLVTWASSVVSTFERRDGVIRQTIKCRK